MTSDDVIKIFKDINALLEGHFIYASGRHGNRFLQAARVLQYPEHVSALCKAIADHYGPEKPDLVVGPATGGIILAYETARHLGCRGVFAEKENDGGMAVKRGFAIPEGIRTLVVEDIITTGGSVKKTINHLRERGADIIGVGALIDRSGGKAEFDCPFHALGQIQLDSWAPDEVPAELAAIPVMEPDDLVL